MTRTDVDGCACCLVLGACVVLGLLASAWLVVMVLRLVGAQI